jgi:hypothetical protein
MGASPLPSCLIFPSFSRLDAIGAGPRVQETLASGDVVGQEARRSRAAVAAEAEAANGE